MLRVTETPRMTDIVVMRMRFVCPYFGKGLFGLHRQGAG